MTAVRRLIRHYVIRRPHTPRHAKPVATPDNTDHLERSQ